jgi:hypothetical protein
MKLAIGIALLFGTFSAAGCWPFGSDEPTAQQRFLEALNRGQAAQASQIWLRMTPEERVEFSHSEGIKPAGDPEKVQEDVIKRFMLESGQVTSDAGIEQVTPPAGGSLQDLPRYLNESSGTAPAK